MRTLRRLALMLTGLLAALPGATFAADLNGLMRYRDANARLGPPAPGEKRVVFIGDSITEGWVEQVPAFFSGRPFVGRGISGQTTRQILARFRQDVVALHPAVVVILAGTNDIAQNEGAYDPQATQANLAAMGELARKHGIRVVLASVLPVRDYPWRLGLAPAPKVAALNAFLAGLASRSGYVYLDYHAAMADAQGALRTALGDDGVHPNLAGYRVMAPLAEQAIAAALAQGDATGEGKRQP